MSAQEQPAWRRGGCPGRTQRPTRLTPPIAALRAAARRNPRSRSHGVGKFWPCPCLGEQMPAKVGRWPAGPCVFEPNARKYSVKEHLKLRHGKTEPEATALLAGLVAVMRE